MSTCVTQSILMLFLPRWRRHCMQRSELMHFLPFLPSEGLLFSLSIPPPSYFLVFLATSIFEGSILYSQGEMTYFFIFLSSFSFCSTVLPILLGNQSELYSFCLHKTPSVSNLPTCLYALALYHYFRQPGRPASSFVKFHGTKHAYSCTIFLKKDKFWCLVTSGLPKPLYRICMLDLALHSLFLEPCIMELAVLSHSNPLWPLCSTPLALRRHGNEHSISTRTELELWN